jgi:hypothetical protein
MEGESEIKDLREMKKIKIGYKALIFTVIM